MARMRRRRGYEYDENILAESKNFELVDVPHYSRIDIGKKRYTPFEKRHLIGDKGSIYVNQRERYYNVHLQNVIYKKDLIEITKLLLKILPK